MMENVIRKRRKEEGQSKIKDNACICSSTVHMCSGTRKVDRIMKGRILDLRRFAGT